MTRVLRLLLVALLAGVGLVAASTQAPPSTWSDAQLARLRGLWIGSLAPLPPDPSNRVADDPRAAALGQRLFFDTRFSASGEVACATCHRPGRQFQDGIPLAKGVGTTDRRTTSLVGTAHSPWQLRDGRKVSLWAQALGPLESAVEHGGDRTQYAQLAARHYRSDYEALFGALPDLRALPAHAGPVKDPAARAAWERMSGERRDEVTRVFANLGKAIAAYERRLLPGASRFDAYVEAALRRDTRRMEATLSQDEVAGLRLFIGEAGCVQCHGGPLLTDHGFHDTGVPAAPGRRDDAGRLAGVRQVRDDEFNCLGRYSDARAEQCGALRLVDLDNPKQLRRFRPPSLRSVRERAPYMHAGQYRSLGQVLDHYNRAPAAPQGHSELKPMGLTRTQLGQLEAFLGTLSAPVAAEARWLEDPLAASRP